MAGIDIPAPTAQENELTEIQGQALRRSRLGLQDLKPFTLEALGLRYDVNGKVERIPSQDIADPFLVNFKEAQKQRLLGTYRSPQMETGLLSYKNSLPATGSTIGNQANEIYNRNEGILREGINRGGLQSGANLIAQREGLLSNLNARGAENYAGMNNADMKLISGIQSALAPYQAIREQAFGANVNEANLRSQKRGQNIQVAGTAVSAIGVGVAIYAL